MTTQRPSALFDSLQGWTAGEASFWYKYRFATMPAVRCGYKTSLELRNLNLSSASWRYSSWDFSMPVMVREFENSFEWLGSDGGRD